MVSETEDPAIAATAREAVYIGQGITGDTLIMGDESREEWIRTSDISALDLEEVR